MNTKKANCITQLTFFSGYVLFYLQGWIDLLDGLQIFIH
jgi:hypothetical protein